MAVLTPPAEFVPSRFTLAPVSNTQSGGRSPFTGSLQTLEMPGQRWAASLQFEGLTAEEWLPILAFLAQLGGQAGRFDWAPPWPARRGTAAAGAAPGPRVATAGQTGKTIQTTGWAAGGLVARAGDLIGWADPAGRPALHMVTGDVAASAGTVAIPIAPMIRRAPAANAPLVYPAPPARWMLTANRTPLDIRPGMVASGSVEIEEALF